MPIPPPELIMLAQSNEVLHFTQRPPPVLPILITDTCTAVCIKAANTL